MCRAEDAEDDLISLDEPPSPPTLAESLFGSQRKLDVVFVSLADETWTYDDVTHPKLQIRSFWLGRDASKLDLTKVGELADLEFLDLGDRHFDRQGLFLALRRVRGFKS